MAHAHINDFELHAVFDGEAPPERVAEILPRLLDDPGTAELLVALEEQRQALVALREALDESLVDHSPRPAEIEIGQRMQRDRKIRMALAALGAVGLLLCLGLEPERVFH